MHTNGKGHNKSRLHLEWLVLESSGDARKKGLGSLILQFIQGQTESKLSPEIPEDKEPESKQALRQLGEFPRRTLGCLLRDQRNYRTKNIRSSSKE